jgi:glycosyltransferase involved in cell wall biosynthesis
MAATVWLAEQPLPIAYRRAGYHAISESTRDDLVDRGVDPGRIRVIHPGVDCIRYRPDPTVGRTADPTFVYVGRLKRYKGVDLAIRALALAREQRPDLRLDIAGDGDHLEALQQLARDTGQGEAVRFLGYVSEEEKLRLFRTAWANVFPSPKEGWGITVMEAAACGTPSIASDSPGLRDSVRAGTTGWLVPHGDAAALARQYLALAGDRGLVDRFGVAARQHAERLTWDAATGQTEAQLQDLVKDAHFR